MNLVVLDRDGVVNFESDDYIKSPEEWEPIPGSLEAIARLHRADVRVVVATNQSGLKRHLLTVEALNAIHAKMQRRLIELGAQLEAIAFCPCLPKDGCECYKPRPGMLLDIAARLHTSLGGVPVIGDSMRDIEAARAAGARPILVRTGNGEAVVAAGTGLDGVEIFDDLAAAVDALLLERGQSERSAKGAPV